MQSEKSLRPLSKISIRPLSKTSNRPPSINDSKIIRDATNEALNNCYADSKPRSLNKTPSSKLRDFES
jgi:hypothetical protein